MSTFNYLATNCIYIALQMFSNLLEIRPSRNFGETVHQLLALSYD